MRPPICTPRTHMWALSLAGPLLLAPLGCTVGASDPDNFGVPSASQGATTVGGTTSGDGGSGGSSSGGASAGDGSTGGDPSGGGGSSTGGSSASGGTECGNGALDPGEECDGDPAQPNVACEACTLVCADGYGDCNGNMMLDGCEVWLEEPSNCGMCGRACAAGTSCVMSECVATQTYGEDQEFPDGNVALAHNLMGDLISVPAGVTLTHLALYSKQAGVPAQFALYQDVGGSPGALVAATAEVMTTVGRMEIPVTPTAIAAGDYWMMAVLGQNGSWGLDTSDASAVITYVPFTFGTPIPDPYPEPATYTGQTFNFFIVVEP